MVALSLAIFLTILVVLLADLICAHLRRQRLRAEASRSKLLVGTPPFYYAHGVLHTPTSTKDLVLAIPRLEGAVWWWSPARRSSPSLASSRSGSSTHGVRPGPGGGRGHDRHRSGHVAVQDAGRVAVAIRDHGGGGRVR